VVDAHGGLPPDRVFSRCEQVSIATAAEELGPSRWLVAAWFSAIDADGVTRKRGAVEVLEGDRRDVLARAAIAALEALSRATIVRFVTRKANDDAPPGAATLGALRRAAARHSIRWVAIEDGAEDATLASAERFAAARAAVVRAAPTDAIRPSSLPERPQRRLFD